MSLVGTRPPTVDEWDKYELHHRARLATKPGLTGMWQVSGRSNITDFTVLGIQQTSGGYTAGDISNYITELNGEFHLGAVTLIPAILIMAYIWQEHLV